MTKTTIIGGKEYRMRASALTPRLYRAFFKRDLIRDMQGLITVYNKVISLPETATEEEQNQASLELLDHLEVFENTAWLFCKEAGEKTGDSPEEWLDSIDGVFSIYEAMPAIIEIWGENQITTSNPKNPQGPR
jgi:hypothetical protein